ncbi:hypothetical protein LUZ60_013480 [Juncus effusus]|nr:hypothetical protein LUZ60_013480 [Juncus effusus]
MQTLCSLPPNNVYLNPQIREGYIRKYPNLKQTTKPALSPLYSLPHSKPPPPPPSPPMPLLPFLLILTTFPSPSSPSPSESSALLSFKHSITLDPTSYLSTWTLSASHCTWPGVTCEPLSGEVYVTSVTLSSLSLSGRLSPDIFLLPHLKLLELSRNNLSGEIPTGISNCTNLEALLLDENNIQGNIPAELGKLSNLKVLDLSRNNLSGEIPPEIAGCTNLEALALNQNALQGGIPGEIGRLARLKVLELSRNRLIGPLPPLLFRNQCFSLTELKLAGNFLTGGIPLDISGCTNLEALILGWNIFEGEIPREIGKLSNLKVLDLSRNSLTGRVPRQLSNCQNLSVLILTNLDNVEEFNAFTGGIPREILEMPSLEILWAPRANLDFEFPKYRKINRCNLRIMNLGQNYISGKVPNWIANCSKLEFLDLSSNYLNGSLPVLLPVSCMAYFNVSRNFLSGPIVFDACAKSTILEGENANVYDYDSYYRELFNGAVKDSYLSDDSLVVLHDFSWNWFSGPLPILELGFEKDFSYGLSLDHNMINGLIPNDFFGLCKDEKLNGFAVNLSSNYLSGNLDLISNCAQLKSFESANNSLNGSISISTGDLQLLENLILKGNNLSGEIPSQIGKMISLKTLDLSLNALFGTIPTSLPNASRLETLVLSHNKLCGNIPPNLSNLVNLTTLDLSFNNLSGEIPSNFKNPINCDSFYNNPFLNPCPKPHFSPPTEISEKRGTKLKTTIIIASTTIASLLISSFIISLFLLYLRKIRRKNVRISILRKKLIVTFTETPLELTYENIIQSTNNFSLQNLIGTGGFGSTYKSEPVLNYFLAIKRLSMNKFHGLKQFDAEIQTLGRIKHKNLVTLIGYHTSSTETFLIYNYLSKGNLETFIQKNNKTTFVQIYKIALDVAQAICYLHYSCTPRIIHRDIKPSNILLDEKLNAYLSDFGLAKLLERSETHSTTDVAGTFGYVAPEYAATCRVSDKSDVYSFGVVLLELISGKKTLDESFVEFGDGFNIVNWGRLLVREEREDEFFGVGLREEGFEVREKLVRVLRLGLSCTDESVLARPSMRGVVSALKQLRSL